MVREFDIAAVDSLAPGSCRTVEVKGRKLALCNIDGEFYAIDDACSHRGGPLGAGCIDGEHLMCPLHGWAFDPRTGACITRPDQPVRSYTIHVREGRVWVELEVGVAG